MKTYTFTKSYEMLEEAKKYVPGGIYGPRSPMFLTFGSYPCFLERGDGCHIWDVDGNEYIDYMCSFGTNILGLNHPGVEEAARRQQEKGNCFTLPSNRWNELAKRLVGLISGMDWTVFSKNGSDVTSYAVTVARHFTKKRVVIMASGAYHGAHFWCTHSTNGIPPEYQAFVEHFTYNDVAGLTALFEKHKDEVAAVMLTPFHHPAMADQVMPDKGFYDAVRSLCDKNGSLMIIDDIRCNFRLHLNGSHVYFGAKPDLVTMGKAMANGHPIGACLGIRKTQGSGLRRLFLRHPLLLGRSHGRGDRHHGYHRGGGGHREDREARSLAQKGAHRPRPEIGPSGGLHRHRRHSVHALRKRPGIRNKPALLRRSRKAGDLLPPPSQLVSVGRPHGRGHRKNARGVAGGVRRRE